MTYWVWDDGGREAAGFRGEAGDCGARAAAIATSVPYLDAYDRLAELGKQERPRGGRKRSHPRTGVMRDTFDKYLAELGWEWTPCMTIGSGCQVHVDAEELPLGPLVLRLSGHYAAFVDGVLYDTYDSSRDGTRCVYGLWAPTEP